MTPSHPPAPSRFPRTETEQSLAARFESQARRHPDRVAVLCGGERVSYADLDHRASAVARAIAARLGPAAQPVAVSFDPVAPRPDKAGDLGVGHPPRGGHPDVVGAEHAEIEVLDPLPDHLHREVVDEQQRVGHRWRE